MIFQEVEAGDYLAAVYRTPSNGGSLMRSYGTVRKVERDASSTDVWVEDENHGGECYFHINHRTGDYAFFEDTDDLETAQNRRVEKLAWTPNYADD